MGGRSISVGEVMTSRVRTADPGIRLAEIWPILVEEHCHHLPIVEDGKPVGMISIRDIVRIARKHGVHSLSDGLPSGETAGEVMSTQLQTIHIEESVDAAIDRIGLGEIHALLVLDDDGGLAGIVTNHDLLRYLAS